MPALYSDGGTQIAVLARLEQRLSDLLAMLSCRQSEFTRSKVREVLEITSVLKSELKQLAVTYPDPDGRRALNHALVHFPRLNTDPLRGHWYSKLYEARIDITYHLAYLRRRHDPASE